METVLLWLLISLPGNSLGNNNVPATRIAAFADFQECERVRALLASSTDFGRSQPMRCVQARVVKGYQ